jgi:hypothetical protein
MNTALKGIEIKKEVIITKVSDASGDYIIPEEVDGCVVTGIGNRAFDNCKNLRSVTIPEGVSQIDGGAFNCCDCLESFYVAKENARYKVIDGFLMEDDDTLVAIPGIMENVKIPSCVTKIGDDVCAGTKIKSVTFPDGITEIGENAFSFCYELGSIDLPKGISEIKKETFFGCHNLKELVIPEGVVSIGDGAIQTCLHMTKLVLPSTL